MQSAITRHASFQFLAVFVLVSILLVGCAHQHQPTQAGSIQWPFSIQGQIPDTDIAQIIAVIQHTQDIDRRIVWIEAQTANDVQVYTGKVRGPLNGGGHVVTLKKRKSQWIIIGDPRESVWVS